MFLRKRPRIVLIEWGILALGILTLVATVAAGRYFERLDHLVQDATSPLLHRAPHPDIVIVAMDDKSIEAIGRWPWRRALHAKLIDQISEASPKAIGLDILLTEADREHPDDDVFLVAAMQRSGLMVLPLMMQVRNQREEAVPPLPGLAAAARLGHIHLGIDTDGVARSVFMREGFKGQMWDHFSQEMIDRGSRADDEQAAPALARQPLVAPEQTLKYWQQEDSHIIPYAGGPGHFMTLSYIDVLRGDVDPAHLRGKYVLIGATAVGMGDVFATPAADDTRLMPGVEILANVLDSLLHGLRIRPASIQENLWFNLTPVLIGLLGLLRLNPLHSLVLLGSVMGLVVAVTGLSPSYCGIQFAPSAALAGLILVYPLWSWRRLSAAVRYLADEFRRLRADSSQVTQLLHTQPDPTCTGDFLDHRIDAVRIAVAQLRDLHRFIRDSIEHQPDPLLVADLSGIIRIANRAAVQHFKVDHADALHGRPLHQILQDVVTLPERQRMVTEEALCQPAVAIQGEGRDAGGRTVLLRCVPFVNDDNQPAGWLASVIDLTAIRQAQKQNEEALRFISHDIRAPNSSILTLLELQRTNPDLMTAAEMIERIERHAQNALGLADDFVYLARAEASDYRFEEVDLVGLLSQLVDDAWAAAYARQVRIELPDHIELALCQADYGLFSRAVGNVLGNAIKFSPTGGSVHCAIHERPAHWVIRIRDQGPGISAVQQEQLFQPYRRLHDQSHPAVEGLGLGLHFVHTVIQRHQGAIEIDSSVGQGCTFNLVLPKPASTITS